MRTTTDVQQFLMAAGYPVGPSGADGRFGQDTLDAYNRWRASKGEPPIGPKQFTLSQVSADIWPEDVPPPVIHQPSIFDQIAVLTTILNLAEGKTMNITVDQITGLVRLVLGIAAGLLAARGIGSPDLWTWITTGVLAAIPAVWSWVSNRPKTIVPIAAK